MVSSNQRLDCSLKLDAVLELMIAGIKLRDIAEGFLRKRCSRCSKRHWKWEHWRNLYKTFLMKLRKFETSKKASTPDLAE